MQKSWLLTVQNYLSLWLLFLSIPLAAQKEKIGMDQKIHFENLAIKDGLSQSTVLSIVQDKYGFMWFGTRDGLNHYDGYDFKVYKYDKGDSTSIGGNIINSLSEDKAGNLYIGTDKGLSIFIEDKDFFANYSIYNYWRPVKIEKTSRLGLYS